MKTLKIIAIVLIIVLLFAGHSNAYEEKEVKILKPLLIKGNLKAAVNYINNGRYDYEKKKRAGFAFGISAGLGRIDYCNRFLGMGANVRFDTNWFDSPMVQAVRGNHPEIFKYLIDMGVSPRVHNKKLIKAAAEVGMIEFIKICRKLNVRVNTQYMLSVAVLKGQVEMVDYLLRDKADPYRQLRDGTLLLSIPFKSINGTEKNRDGVIRVLLKNRVNLNRANKRGWTSIAIALKRGDKKMVQRLISYGANPISNIDKAVSMGEKIRKSLFQLNAINILKLSPKQYGHLIETAKNGGNISEIINTGNPSEKVKQKRLSYALNAAIRNGNAKMTETVISLGADVEKGGYEAKAPIYMAIESRFPEVIEVLVKKGVKLDKRVNGRIPLYFAVRTNSAPVVKAVLKGEAGIKIFGNYALNEALKLKNHDIIEALLDSDADPNSPKVLLLRIKKIPGYGTDPVLTKIEKLLADNGADRLTARERKRKKQGMYGIYVWLTLFIIWGFTIGRIGANTVYNALLTLKWEETKGTITSSSIVEQVKKKRGFRLRFYYIPVIKYRYRVSDETFKNDVIYIGFWKSNIRRSAEKLVERFQKGKEVPVYYDPDFPDDAVLIKGKTHPVNIFLSFTFVIGIISLIAMITLFILSF